MQNFHLHDGSIARFGFYDNIKQPVHVHTNIEVFYLLEGEIDFQAEGVTYNLGSDSMLIVNPGVKHSHVVSSDALDTLYVCLHLNYLELCRRLGLEHISFNCNTALLHDDWHKKLRALLKRILNYRNAAEPKGENLYLESLYFHLLSVLVNHFLDDAPEDSVRTTNLEENIRVEKIRSFIQSNYKNPISLVELADKLYLSQSYLSKYIKKHFGMNFTDYLNSVRLAHAVEELQTTKKSITRIAADNGFPNTASFNRVYKEMYHNTPSVHAKATVPPKQQTKQRQKSDECPPEKVQSYFENHSPDNESGQSSLLKQVLADAEVRNTYTKSWNKMINIGPSSDLFISDTREHLMLIKQELGFEFVRFWDLYQSIMYLDIDSPQDRYNFTKLDRLFDFLIHNEMRPYIQLGFKPIQVMRSGDHDETFMIKEQRDILFESPSEYEDFLSAFIYHYSSRYGLDEVEHWYFEQWIDPRQTVDGDYSSYFEMFEAAYRALKSVSPHLLLGSGGLSFQKNTYRTILQAWYGRSIHPDFFSAYCYPYTNTPFGKPHICMKDQVSIIREAALDAGFKTPVIHVSEWNFTVSDRNILNDSCFKGAYIIKNIFETMSHVGFLGYWLASDLRSEFTDTNLILNGSGGILSRDGIKKPAYHAFYFLSRLGKYLLAQDENCYVTSDGHDNYTLVCHNYQQPNFKYFLKADDKQDISDLPNLFENNRLYVQVRIEGVKNGLYMIKTNSINEVNGSVQNEWVRMGKVELLNNHEIDYLKKICVPRISIRTCDVRNSVLLIDLELTLHEIQCIHLTYQFNGEVGMPVTEHPPP